MLTKPKLTPHGKVVPGKRLSNIYVKNARTSLLAPAFEWALLPGENGEPPIRTLPSPFAMLDSPPLINKRKHILKNTEEIDTFTSVIYGKEMDDQEFADLLLVKMCSGTRYGEITAILVDVVDFAARGIHIRRKLVRGQLHEYNEEEGNLKDGAKTAAGVRFIPLPPEAMEVLKQKCGGKGPQEFVFLGPSGTHWLYGTYHKRWTKVRKLLAANGITKHILGRSLRNLFISTLRARNTVDPVISRKVSGHTKDQMQDHYTELTDEAKDSVIDAVSGSLRGAR